MHTTSINRSRLNPSNTYSYRGLKRGLKDIEDFPKEEFNTKRQKIDDVPQLKLKTKNQKTENSWVIDIDKAESP